MANKKSYRQNLVFPLCVESRTFVTRQTRIRKTQSLHRAESTETIRRARNAYRVVKERRKRNSNVAVTGGVAGNLPVRRNNFRRNRWPAGIRIKAKSRESPARQREREGITGRLSREER